MIDYPAFRVLRWLSTDTADNQHPPYEVCPAEDQKGVYDELLHAGLIQDTETMDGSFSFVLSLEGRSVARRTVREYRPELARRCVLSFLNAVGDFAERRGLEDSEWATDYTGALTAREIDEAADDLETLQLIKGTRQAGGAFYIFAITPAGRRALRGPAPIGDATNSLSDTHLHTSTNTTVTGDNNQIAAGIHGAVDQAMSIDSSTTVAADYQNIEKVIRDLLDQLPRLSLDEPDEEDLRSDAQTVLGEIVSSEPDKRIIRRALNGLRGLLSPLALGVSQAATAESAEIARQAFDHINASGLV